MKFTSPILATPIVAAALLARIAAQDQGVWVPGPDHGAPVVPLCTVEHLQSRAPAGTTITAAADVPASDNIPRHCRVDGHAVSVNNTVNFRVGLPENWNGKFYFQGVGGLGGTIGSLNAGLARGYASASTDTGHAASDRTWWSNREKEIDYGHRGTHVATVAAKAVVAAWYGRDASLAYFNGCSNGGRQALMEVQRYPGDYDGVISGDPATGTSMQIGRAVVYQQMLSSPERYLPAAKIEVLSRATVAACDAADGLEDGLVSDPRACDFRPETLLCQGADGADCLTAGQMETVKAIYAGARTAAGEQISAPFPVGHEGGRTGWTQWIAGTEPPAPQPDGTLAYGSAMPSGFRLQEQNFAYLALDEDDPAFNWRVFDINRDLPRLRMMSEILEPNDPNLAPFRDQRGKLILYHGWSDPGISALGTLEYYERVVTAVGGQAAADEFARLYLIPGMHHCSGGPGPNSFDMLPVLETWVERGVAPSRVVASHSTDGVIDRTRPLCPYPQTARYTGRGRVDDESGFVCQAPAPRTAGSWLDGPLAPWNAPASPVPRASLDEPLTDLVARCRLDVPTSTDAERAVGAAGWIPFLLFDREMREHGLEIIGGMTGADGMCRPLGFNAFVFVNGRFAGTLSPVPMSSRTDGVLGAVRSVDAETVAAEFSRYANDDALCCPSRRMSVRYRVAHDDAPAVAPADVRTIRGY